METKKKIRQEILAKRDALPVLEKKRLSKKISDRIKNLPAFIKAEKLLLFVGYGSEPDTIPFIEECLQKGKEVYCPVVLNDTMEFYRIYSPAELKEGYKGILEPLPVQERKYVPGEYDFMLVPGTAFDRQGNRIGYGKGFYPSSECKEESFKFITRVWEQVSETFENYDEKLKQFLKNYL